MKKCTFCGEEQKEGLIEGKEGAICSKCLIVCNAILFKGEKEEIEAKLMGENKLSEMNPSDIKERIDNIVIGQEEAKMQLIMEFYKHYKLKAKKRNNVFLLGNSGVGKTFLVRNLAEVIGVPFIEFDSTTFSETGYKGRDVSEIIEELYAKCDGNKEKTESAVVFIDEIDKIITTSNGEGVNKIQHALLKMVEGVTYSIPKGRTAKSGVDVIDTSKILFVVAGACVGIEDVIKKRTTKSGNIGFSKKETQATEESSTEIRADDLISFGFIPEFIGRFPLIVQLKDLTKTDYYSILVHSKEAIIPEYISLFEKEDIALTFMPTMIEELVESAISSPLGVRGMQNSLVKALNGLLFESLVEGKTTASVHTMKM